MVDNHHNRKSAHEIERDVEAARAKLVGSIEDLEARLSPDALVEQGIAYFRGGGRRHLDSVVRSVEANPIALALIGFGVAWLALGPRSRPRTIDRQVTDDLAFARDGQFRRPDASPPAPAPRPIPEGVSIVSDQSRTTGPSADARSTRSGEKRDDPPSGRYPSALQDGSDGANKG